LIDVSINHVNDPSQEKDYRLAGDIAFKEAYQMVLAITSASSGVGLITIAMLLKNPLRAVDSGS